LLGVGFWLAFSSVWPFWPTVAVLLLVTIFGCEVLPKTLAVRRPELWAMRVAAPMRFFQKLTLPLRWLAQKLDESIVRVLVPKSIKSQTALTDADYQELIELATQQGVMKPRSRMASIADDLTVEQMIAAARKFKHRRLPMYDETPDTIVGILNTRALLLDPNVDLADAIEFPSFVPESMNLLQLLKSLQRQKRGMAVVLDEFGGTAGLVTMEDILGQLVGKIRAEVESDGFVMEKLSPGRWRVNGTMRLDDFRREHPELGEVAEVETMGGLLAHLLGVVPTRGESAMFRGLKLTAQVAEDRRVRELLVEKNK
jgi:putative hemolysin